MPFTVSYHRVFVPYRKQRVSEKLKYIQLHGELESYKDSPLKDHIAIFSADTIVKVQVSILMN